MLTKNILHGPRIRLTAVAKADLPTISVWYEDSAYSRMFDATPAVPKSQAQLEQWLEGVFREFIQRDGRRHDMILFGLLRREWAERLSNLEINPS